MHGLDALLSTSMMPAGVPVATMGIGKAGASNAAVLGGMAAVYSIVALGFAVADLVFGFGAWTLKPWAWMLGMVLFGLNIVFQLVAVVAGWATFGGVLISLVISGVIIYYLLTPEVKKAFGRP
jgi:uncharacterized membrane protein (DUF2068 family)